MRRTIVVAEVAVSLVLICGALLMFKSLLKLQRVDRRVRIDNVITMSVDLPLGDLSAIRDAATRFIEQAAERLQRGSRRRERRRCRPTCRCAACGRATAITIPGVDEGVGARFKRVDPNYFATLDIPVLAGRGFTRHDRAGTPRVIVVNEALADAAGAAIQTRQPGRRRRQDREDCGTACTRTAVRPASKDATPRSSA